MDTLLRTPTRAKYSGKIDALFIAWHLKNVPSQTKRNIVDVLKTLKHTFVK